LGKKPFASITAKTANTGGFVFYGKSAVA